MTIKILAPLDGLALLAMHGWPTNPSDGTPRGGWGWGCFAWGPLPPRKAPHSALLALLAMQPPVRPIFISEGNIG